jgi:hypothetical protein
MSAVLVQEAAQEMAKLVNAMQYIQLETFQLMLDSAQGRVLRLSHPVFMDLAEFSPMEAFIRKDATLLENIVAILERCVVRKKYLMTMQRQYLSSILMAMYKIPRTYEERLKLAKLANAEPEVKPVKAKPVKPVKPVKRERGEGGMAADDNDDDVVLVGVQSEQDDATYRQSMLALSKNKTELLEATAEVERARAAYEAAVSRKDTIESVVQDLERDIKRCKPSF